MKELYMVKEFISDYINIVINKTFVITVISSIFVSHVNDGRGYAFLPFILAVMCMLSYIPFYIQEDMTLKQILLLRGFGLVILEISICYAVFCITGSEVPTFGYIAIIIFTAFYDVLSYMIQWYMDMEEADRINRMITEYHINKKVTPI